MSARKLQQEIDKVNKKIGEGLTIFNGIYDKLMSTDIQSQKEKLESDLKKEIKKLQRMRDQLKNWLNNSDIKLDKNVLQSNREKIEYAMEQFKNLEKNMKIKQFSNEGLNLQSSIKSNLFIDPNQQKKLDAYEFISNVIDDLSQQNESLEGKISLINSTTKKKPTSASIEDLQFFLERNNEHLNNLEKILKFLENEKLDPELIIEMKEDLNYYVESNQDEDFFENELLYDELGLDEEEEEVIAAGTSISNDSPSPSAGHVNLASTITNSSIPSSANGHVSSISTPIKNNVIPALNPIINNSNGNVISNTPIIAKKILKPISVSNSGTPKMNFATVAAQQIPPGLSKQTSLNSSTPSPITTPSILSSQQNHQINQNPLTQTLSQTPTTYHNNHATSSMIQSQTNSYFGDGEEEHDEYHELSFISEYIPNFKDIQERYKKPLPIEDINTLLESSLLNCPDSFDAEKPRSYFPTRAHPTSIDYPKEPLYELNSMKIMSNFDNDTLFYCFYYHQNEIWCINSAKILSERGWVFNTESKQWLFKIVENSSPISIKDDTKINVNGNINSEENWKYFDFESWLPRRKDNFQFDRELRESF